MITTSAAASYYSTVQCWNAEKPLSCFAAKQSEYTTVLTMYAQNTVHVCPSDFCTIVDKQVKLNLFPTQ